MCLPKYINEIKTKMMPPIKYKLSLSLLICAYFISMNSCYAAEQNVQEKPPEKIQLNSDHFKIDGKTGIFEQCGHAVLTQAGLTLSAECITGKQNEDGTYAYIIATGQPASLLQINQQKQNKLLVKANSIEYKVAIEHFLITGKAELQLTSSNQDDVFISADIIKLDNRHPLRRDIHAMGSPIQIEVIKSGKTELKAKSKKLHFNTGTYNLILSKDVVANLGQKQISAGVFNYNSKTEVSSFEKSNNEQIEIIQTKKKP